MFNLISNSIIWLLKHVFLLVIILLVLSISTWFIKPVIENWTSIVKAQQSFDATGTIESESIDQLRIMLGEQQSKRSTLESKIKNLEDTLNDLRFYEVEERLGSELSLVKNDKDLQLTETTINQLELMIAFRDGESCQGQCEVLQKRCISALRTEGAMCPAPFPCTTIERWLPVWRDSCPIAEQRCTQATRIKESICAKARTTCDLCKVLEDPGKIIKVNVTSEKGELLSTLNTVRDFVTREILAEIWRAFLILLAIVFSPLLVNIVAFYAIAPLASCLFSLRLKPNKLLVNSNEISDSQVSLSVPIKGEETAVVKSDYVRATPANASTRTRWFLNKSIPLTSISTGLVTLTEIRGEGMLQIGVESSVGFEKLVSLRLSEDNELALHPRHIVGVIEKGGAPIKVRKVWQLHRLSAWLTFRLRHLVFSGNAVLIVKGNQGVELLPVTAESPITVTDFIGYSANLEHRVVRSDTFLAFHRNQQELFKHRFGAAEGFVLQETRAIRTQTSATGWSIRRFIDAILKMFGV